jgi:hypothetical protein
MASRKLVAKSKQDPDKSLTPREEYRAALDELNQYSHNNETTEAQEARERFDRADRLRTRWSLR